MKKIAISLGDPLGIGPEIVDKALLDKRIKGKADFILFGSPFLGKKISPRMAGSIAFKAIEDAVKFTREHPDSALVTAPVSKKNLALAGFKFPGHTEYLAHAFKIKKYAMMLFHDKLRVVLVTIHEPIKKVASLLSADLILEKLILTVMALQENFQISNPRIGVAGFNPHAGEAGEIGNEEIKKIIPAIQRFKKLKIAKKCEVIGPIPADTIMVKAVRGEMDAVICMYHDQGLIPLKLLGFDKGVNMTLGLPIIRTSPDHGTAFDIAGKNKADPESMVQAILWATQFS